MRLLVGLGNPGPKYDATRHNVGFAAVDAAARAAGADDWRVWAKSLVCKGSLAGAPLLFAKPQTFMNLSGEAVQALMAFYKIAPADVAVATDDVTLPLGSLRIRASGGHGGHNGLRDIIARVGEAFPRIRIGVGLCPPERDLSSFVLARLSPADQTILSPVIGEFPEILETVLTKGWDLASSRHGRRAEGRPDA
jgi:PTH1 family peptidyl-tRNA hydrolase